MKVPAEILVRRADPKAKSLRHGERQRMFAVDNIGISSPTPSL